MGPLTTNPVYKGVIDLYLDGNKIESIVQLEGSSWMDHFRLFSLRGNKLTDVCISFSMIGKHVTETKKQQRDLHLISMELESLIKN